MARMNLPQSDRYAHFTPWIANDTRTCRTCSHATGYDGVHLWCTQHNLVVVDACAWWMREPGADEQQD